MKIEWLNADCTEVAITRGVWWWKRRAIVRRVVVPETKTSVERTSWQYASGRPFFERVDLSWRRDIEISRRKLDEDWQPITTIPLARLVERKP
jgi:hypothetical protein